MNDGPWTDNGFQFSSNMFMQNAIKFHQILKPGFHYTANATTTTQEQSDYKVEQSPFTLIALFWFEIGRCRGRNWPNGNQALSFCKHLPDKRTVWTKVRLTGSMSSYVLIMPMIISLLCDLHGFHAVKTCVTMTTTILIGCLLSSRLWFSEIIKLYTVWWPQKIYSRLSCAKEPIISLMECVPMCHSVLEKQLLD